MNKKVVLTALFVCSLCMAVPSMVMAASSSCTGDQDKIKLQDPDKLQDKDQLKDGSCDLLLLLQDLGAI